MSNSSHIKILVSGRRLKRRIRELGRRISIDYRDKDLTIVYVANGAILFTADLVRAISVPLKLDCIAASSYSGNRNTGRLRVGSRLKLDIRGRDVLLVDDVLDSGLTMDKLISILKKSSPSSIKVCVLLEKSSRREAPVSPDYIGFRVPDVFLVGYGLDWHEYCRNLDFVGYVEDKDKQPF